jgi:hypothetical protein
MIAKIAARDRLRWSDCERVADERKAIRRSARDNNQWLKVSLARFPGQRRLPSNARTSRNLNRAGGVDVSSVGGRTGTVRVSRPRLWGGCAAFSHIVVGLALTVACSATESSPSEHPASGESPVTASGTVESAQMREGLSKISRCEPTSEWCTPTPANTPVGLRRPLRLPASGARCRASAGHHFETNLFGGIALGEGPVRPVVAVRRRQDIAPALNGALHFYPYYGDRTWFALKTLWYASPTYRGPVLIRGRQIDGPHSTVFGEQPELVDPLLRAGPTTYDIEGFREWPGATYLRAPGCYAWQVDGLDFSTVIVFNAIFVRS